MTAIKLHATTIAIGRRGVMLLGPSGSGKSDLALRLIDRGALLVSDDYTECHVLEGRLVATPPSTIAGKIEVRGIGIVETPFDSDVVVDLVVRLTGPVDRMPDPLLHDVAGVAVPAVVLEPFEASAPIKVEIALSRLVQG